MKEVLEDVGIEITDEGLRKLQDMLPFDGKEENKGNCEEEKEWAGRG